MSAAAAPAATTPAPAPTPSSQLSFGAPVAQADDPGSGLQRAGFHQSSSNVRPQLPPTVINVLPTGQTAVQVGSTTPAPALGTATTTKSTNTTTSPTSATDTSGGPAKNGSTAASPTADSGKPAAATQQTTTSTTSLNPNSQVQIPFFQVELLSRQVMRIVIPKGVYSNNGMVDVHIATPYGVSPHLAIPVLCSDAKKAAPNLLQLGSDAATATIRCRWSQDKLEVCDGKLEPVNWSPGNLTLKWAASKELTPKSVYVQLDFATPKGKLPSKTMTLTGNGSFNLSVSALTSHLLDSLAGVGQYKPGDALPASIQGTITLLKAGDNPIYDSLGTVSQKVQIQFELVVPTPDLRLLPARAP